jgi:hypothetical protein
VQKAGAIGVLMINSNPWPPSGVSLTPAPPVTDPVRIPSMMLSQLRGAAFRAVLDNQTALTVRMSGRGDQWGSAWLMDGSDPTDVQLLAQLTTTHTVSYPPYNGGTYTAHQPLLANGVAWLAWYGDGLRAFDVRDPRRPREVGYFLPPQAGSGSGMPAPFSWGIGLDERAAYVSDYATGLWILSAEVLDPLPRHERAFLPRLLRGAGP